MSRLLDKELSSKNSEEISRLKNEKRSLRFRYELPGYVTVMRGRWWRKLGYKLNGIENDLLYGLKENGALKLIKENESGDIISY